jgi:hypothetical protein
MECHQIKSTHRPMPVQTTCMDRLGLCYNTDYREQYIHQGQVPSFNSFLELKLATKHPGVFRHKACKSIISHRNVITVNVNHIGA